MVINNFLFSDVVALPAQLRHGQSWQWLQSGLCEVIVVLSTSVHRQTKICNFDDHVHVNPIQH